MKAENHWRNRAVRCMSAVAFLAMAAGPAFAHEGHEHKPGAEAGNAAASEPARAARNRWGADYFPNLPLVNQDGVTVHLYDDLLKGKAVAINVIYTSCKDVCPLETANLARVQRILGERVGKDIFFYSISIDPETDTPPVLKAFAKKFDVGPGWQFLTGKPEDIKLIVRKLGLSRESDKESPDGHTSSLMVGDVAAGQWLRNSAVDNPQFLVAKIGTFLGKWNDLMPNRSYAEVSRPVDLKTGQYLFQSNCSACHAIGEGRRIGPDLKGVTARRERGWLTRYIQVPNKVQAEGDAIAAELVKQFPDVRMPNLNLAAGDVAALIAYLDSHRGAAEKPLSRALVSAH
jgi:protein SCO1/2